MTRTRTILFLASAIIFIAIAAFLVRVQPAGTATAFRTGQRVVVRRTPIYVRAIGVASCRAPIIGDRLAFESDAPSDLFSIHIRLTYMPPPLLPSDWPAGDWCASLQQRVDAVASRVSPGVVELLDQRRQTGDRIAEVIEKDLRRSGVLTSGVSVRIDLPAGFDRLRPVPEVVSRTRAARPVIFIGLDGADWNLLDRYIASGAMPNLKRLVSTGSAGPLETEHPPLSPLVWTTMMTGVSPLQHQILDFTRFNPTTHEKEPITSDERRAPAIWNMLTYGGKEAAVFGLWATYAAEPVHGVNVSDRLFTFLYKGERRPEGVVYPPLRQRWAEQHLDAAEKSIDVAKMREYLPSLTDAEFAALSKAENPYTDPPAALRRILVETEIYRRLSIDFLRGRSPLPDLAIVYFQGTDTIGHVFAPFAPPKQPQVSQSDYDRYSAIPEKYFRHIDSILGEYMAMDAVIVIASDHGFRWSEGRPTEISSTATATAAKWHRSEGIYVLSGAPPPSAAPKGVRDICRILQELTGMPAIDYSRYFQRAAPPPAPTRASNEELAKLRALGYIGANEATRSASPQTDTKTGGAYNNAGLILRQEGRIDAAIASFEHALAIDPRYASAMWNLSETLFNAKRDLDRADALLIAAAQNGLPEATRYIITRSIAYRGAGRSLRLLEQAVTANPNDPELRLFRGRYRMDRHECSAALQDFLAAEKANNALAFASAGLAQMCLGEMAEARESFARAREIDPKLQLPR